jgi:uncharacterized protein involved in exopolysaccharide biosynthesis
MKEVLLLVWKWKLRLVGVWLIVMLLVLFRLLSMAEIYTSSCLLSPLALEQVEGGGGGPVTGTSIRTILGGGWVRDDYSIAAFLRSRQVQLEVVEALNLERELFPKRWDAEEEEWLESQGGAPTDVEILRKMASRLNVTYDDFAGLLLLEIHWWSPEGAKEVADAFVDVGDRMLRDAAIEEGERRVAELRREMEQATVGEVGVFLAEEMTRAISLATSIRARSRYAFRVVDPPIAPDRKSWPPRFLLLMIAGLAVGAVELGAVAAFHQRQQARRGQPAVVPDDPASHD